MKNIITLITFTIIVCIAGNICAKDFILNSPDHKIKATIRIDRQIQYSLSYEKKVYLLPSAIGMTLTDGNTLGKDVRIIGITKNSVNQILKPLYGITKELQDKYNELIIQFSGNYSLAFRVYNEGFAYRFITDFKKDILVQSEKSEFHFNGDYKGYFHTSLSESDYRFQRTSEILKPNYSSMPILFKADDQLNILIHESDVIDYPCMSVCSAGEGKNMLIGMHAAYPKLVEVGGAAKFNLIVKETEGFIAKTKGSRSFPWRLISFERDDKNILNNQLVYLLASKSKLKDESWIKPGKVAWDWWNALNISGVDFKTGFNTETYKYFIDFAANNGLEYINLDEGWSDQFDLLKITNKIDMPVLLAYAKQKKVGIILWCVWRTLDRQMIPALEQFEKWGISGLKVDFMDRDDQIIVGFQERLLIEAAKKKMLVNFHGAYHPNGMERTYPNQINTEGVKGAEWNKFDVGGVSPQTDLMHPFVRMFAGSMDYTPGAMQNYNKTDWKQIFERPMSQGTRCHQLAMYTVYYAPLQMLADAPTAYEKDPIYLKYLSSIPTVWDETIPLDSKVGEYVTIARKKGGDWYMASMTNWTERIIKVKLDFLEADKVYNAEIFMDGPNAERVGSDYKSEEKKVRKDDVISIMMAPGGGWSAKFIY